MTLLKCGGKYWQDIWWSKTKELAESDAGPDLAEPSKRGVLCNMDRRHGLAGQALGGWERKIKPGPASSIFLTARPLLHRCTWNYIRLTGMEGACSRFASSKLPPFINLLRQQWLERDAAPGAPLLRGQVRMGSPPPIELVSFNEGRWGRGGLSPTKSYFMVKMGWSPQKKIFKLTKITLMIKMEKIVGQFPVSCWGEGRGWWGALALENGLDRYRHKGINGLPASGSGTTGITRSKKLLFGIGKKIVFRRKSELSQPDHLVVKKKPAKIQSLENTCVLYGQHLGTGELFQ